MLIAGCNTYPKVFWGIRLGMSSPEARLAQKLLAGLKLTHVPGLKQKCTELGLTRGTLQEWHREKKAAYLAAVEEALRGDFGAEIAAAIVIPKTHGNCHAKRPRLADLAQGADGSCTLSGTPGTEAAASGRPAGDGAKEPCEACAKARDVLQASMRESELQFEVQQLAARNREVELQLKVHKLAQATLRVAEAEGARWYGPRLWVYKCRRCFLHVPDPRVPLCSHALSCDCSLCGPDHKRGATIGLTDGLLCKMRYRDQGIHMGHAQTGTRSTRSRGCRRG